MTETERIANEVYTRHLPAQLGQYLDNPEGKTTVEPQPSYLYANILDEGPNESIQPPDTASLWRGLRIALFINTCFALFVFLVWKFAHYVTALQAFDMGFATVALIVVHVLLKKERQL